MDGMSSEPAKNAEEAVAMRKDLMAQENAILSENKSPFWEKVFMAADKGHDQCRGGHKNYGDFTQYNRICCDQLYSG